MIETKIKASFDAFVRTKDARVLEPLRKKGRIVKNEGSFTRVCFNSYEERDRFCRGDEQKEAFFKKHGVEVFEADLNPVKRWLIDSEAKIQKPISGFLDLETDSRVPFSRKGEARVLCWGLVIVKNGVVERLGGVLEHDTDDSERELLKDLFYELQFVDQILAWNGDNFDFEVLKERIKRLNLGIDFRRWLKCDHMLLFQKYNMTASDSGDQKASMALNRVAESLGVQGKLKEKGVGPLEGVEIGGAKSWQFWAAGGRNRELLLEYCVEDAATMYRIEEAKGFVDILSTLAQTCSVFPDSRGMMGKNFVETFVMALGAKMGMRAPTKYHGVDEATEQFKGAFVFETQVGLFRDVHMCDFSRLYPSIMQAWNMSPETHVNQILADKEDPLLGGRPPLPFEDACKKTERGIAVCPLTCERFRVDGARGLFALALDKIVEQRKYWSNKKYEYKPGSKEFKECKDRDAAYKIIANTFYGVSGSPFSRFFMRELSESVTQIGVWLIQATAKEGEKRGLKLILGDTDSCAMTGCTTEEFQEFIRYCNEELYPSMIRPSGADPKFISLAFEKTLALLINVMRKTYAGRQLHDKGVPCPVDIEPTIKGLEYKRGDTVRLAREFQEEVVKTVLLYGKPIPEDYPLTVKDLVPIVEKWQNRILSGDFEFKDAIFAKRVTKELTEYNSLGPKGQTLPPPAHIRIAQDLIQKGLPIYPGVKIEYVITDGSTSPQTIKYAGDATKDDVDLYHLWENGVWPAAERVLATVWPDYLWKRWGSVRPLKGVLDGQVGFGFGERGAQIH